MACKLRCPHCQRMCKEKGDEMKTANGTYEAFQNIHRDRILLCSFCKHTSPPSNWEDK